MAKTKQKNQTSVAWDGHGESAQPSMQNRVLPLMKSSHLRLLVLTVGLLPALALAAKDGKTKKKPAAAHGGESAEVLKPFDKNDNHQIDPDELAAMQKSFAALRKLDKNSNGEIEKVEVEIPKAPAADNRKGRALAGLQKVDKNGNHKIDADEIEALQKVLAGGRIMTRLDQNGNGKLEPGEVERLNQRIAQGAGGKTKRPSSPPPSVHKTPEKPTESAPPAETVKPAAPAEKPKTPVNFGS